MMTNPQSVSVNLIIDREKGQTDVSIGTSLALESAFNIHPEIRHANIPIKNYDLIYINLSTVFRNIYASLTSEHQNMVSVNDYVDALLSEVNLIDGQVQDITNGSVKTVYYFNDIYKSLIKRYKYAIIKKPTTDRQLIYQSTHDEVLSLTLPLLDGLDVRLFDHDLNGQGRCLLLTHYTTDLLSKYNFDILDLLESHTGKIKPSRQWGSKLGIKDDTMPFNRFTLQLFGDGSTLFSAQPMRFRKPVIELANKDRWSAVTTMSRIKQSLTKINDKDIRDQLLKLTLVI